MPGEKYNEYIENNAESKKEKIDTAINKAKSDLGNLESQILGGRKVDFKTPDSINHFYKIENGKIIFQLDHVKNYLSDVHKRLSGIKNQKFQEISKENNFTGTVLAIQIVLKALETDPKNPKKYNIKKINGDYNETKEAIKIFQSEQGLEGDGKPGKKTIETIIKALENFINNRKTYEHIRSTVKNVLISNTLTMLNSGVLNPERDSILITNYIIKGKLGTGEDANLERKINDLAGMKFGNLEFKKIIKEWKENGRLNILNQDPEFQNTKYDKLIIQLSNKYSNNYKIDPALIKIIMHKESRFDPKAHSGAGAKGLMQLMPIAVKEVNKDKKIIRNVYDPKQNIEGGIKIFSKHLKTFKGHISLALAAYNWGPGYLDGLIKKIAGEMNIKKEELIRKSKENKEFFEKKIKGKLPLETRDYINKIVPKYESLRT